MPYYRGREYKKLPPKPEASTKRRLNGEDTQLITVKLKTVTPILGGGYRTRELDDVDTIRVPTIRGHLRFWWRALYGGGKSSEALYKEECALWGGAGGEEKEEKGEEKKREDNKKKKIGKSQVEISVSITQSGVVDKDINLRDDSAYALWPARGESGWKEDTKKKPPAPRRGETEFTLKVICSTNHETQVKNTLKAWILFGGYGSRTRRGLGSLTVTADQNQWLPAAATKEAINSLFEGLEPFGDQGDFKGDTPRLQGALLYVGSSNTGNGVAAWTTALDKLKEFRQGRGFAREQGGQRPGRSRWPEADKIRRITNRTKLHPPRFNEVNYWPRAGFGLPIGGQFVTPGGRKDEEPDKFKILWRDTEETHDRLASPLILKPLPLTGNTFVPCALWLNRGYPDGKVFVDGLNGSEADFDTLTAPGDEILFKPLEEPDGYKDKYTLREAFLGWLGKQGFREVK